MIAVSYGRFVLGRFHLTSPDNVLVLTDMNLISKEISIHPHWQQYVMTLRLTGASEKCDAVPNEINFNNISPHTCIDIMTTQIQDGRKKISVLNVRN